MAKHDEPTKLNLADIQGNILTAYGRQGFPKGRFFAYPVDKHTQTTQRNQILQPWFSAGLFAGQILALPYNLIVDPPWEAEYDLGYWRPGDRIPTDMYYLPLHGIGPPLRGRQY